MSDATLHELLPDDYGDREYARANAGTLLMSRRRFEELIEPYRADCADARDLARGMIARLLRIEAALDREAMAGGGGHGPSMTCWHEAQRLAADHAEFRELLEHIARQTITGQIAGQS